MKLLLASLLLLSFVSNADELTHGPMPNPAQYNYAIWLAKHLDISDGVQSYEAQVIANVFFTTGVSGCGAPDEPRKEKDAWVFPTFVGVGVEPGPEIRVNRTTGEVSSNGQTMSFEEIQQVNLLDLPDVELYN